MNFQVQVEDVVWKRHRNQLRPRSVPLSHLANQQRTPPFLEPTTAQPSVQESVHSAQPVTPHHIHLQFKHTCSISLQFKLIHLTNPQKKFIDALSQNLQIKIKLVQANVPRHQQSQDVRSPHVQANRLPNQYNRRTIHRREQHARVVQL